MDRARRTAPPAEDAAESGRFGCPMLAPVQWERAAEAGLPTSRCLIAWALHDEAEVERCRATHAVVDCWKAHPERLPLVAHDRRRDPEPRYHAAAAD